MSAQNDAQRWIPASSKTADMFTTNIPRARHGWRKLHGESEVSPFIKQKNCTPQRYP